MTFRDWLADKRLDLTAWTDLPPATTDHQHLWLRDPGDYGDLWASVTDDYETWEFRQCVLCGVKQIKEWES